jgi:hypothetical protein
MNTEHTRYGYQVWAKLFRSSEIGADIPPR